MASAGTDRSPVEDAVRDVINRSLSPLSGMYLEQEENQNPFLAAISHSLSLSSKLTRSLTSKLGRQLASMARELAKARYGEEHVPRVAWGSSVPANLRSGYPAHAADTVIVTMLDERATRQAAMELIRAAGVSPTTRIGTPVFEAEFRRTHEELRRLRKPGQLWAVQVDLLVADPSIGLCELESSGELDSSNAKSQPEKLVLAGLALGEPDMPMHFCLAYANRGEGRKIAGGLTKYLEVRESGETSSGLLVGRRWWERLLPDAVTFERFLELFEQEARSLNIVPAELLNVSS